MTQQQLLKEVRELYKDARKVKSFAACQKQVNEKIKRCTSHSISSEFEDLLAHYCYELINDSSVKIYIDPQMKFEDNSLKNKSGKKILIYRPDILIVKNDKIVAMIDAKTDLGFKKKTYLGYIKQINETIKKIAGQKTVFKQSTDGDSLPMEMSKDIKLTFFVASNQYITKGELGRVKDEEINKEDYVNIFFLSRGSHLNNYNNKEVGTDIHVNTESMENFDNFILSKVQK